ncbi:MAG TPA: hypothetical protein VNC84_01675 [Gammaproteobacteria bacterium]|jgi:hypothetical protein|nr:hypothetical protein [Gammaproteobacteria bacterium]
MSPSEDAVHNFRLKLQDMGVDKVKTQISQRVYGPESNWQHQEAQRFLNDEAAEKEMEIKRASLEQAKYANQLKEQGNKTAKCALRISILSLLISLGSLAVVFFK